MIGLDLLGLGSRHFKVGAVVKAMSKYPGEAFFIGVFDDCPGTFGDPRANLRRLLKTGRVGGVRVQLWYNSEHSLCPLDHLRSRVVLWREFANEFPNVSFFISHTTEHREKDTRMLRERMDLIKTLAPMCVPVNNPLPDGAVLTGYLNETHDMRQLKGAYFASMDGMGDRSDPKDPKPSGYLDIDVAKWHETHKAAAVRMIWTPRFNLNDYKKKLAPRQRTATPSQKHLEAAMAAALIPAVPAKPPQARPIKKPLLYKPLSQDSGGSREDKPMALLKNNIQSCDIVTIDSQRIGSLIYPGAALGDYPGGLRRFYAGWKGGINCWGHEIARKAKDKSSCPLIWLKLKDDRGKVSLIGPVYPATRAGYFRA